MGDSIHLSINPDSLKTQIYSTLLLSVMYKNEILLFNEGLSNPLICGEMEH